MDGNANNQDALPGGGRPSGASGGSPSQPRTYTQDQLDTLIRERHSKLDTEIATLKKERDGLKSSHDSLSQRLADVERRSEEEEETRVKDNPEEHDLFTRRKKLKELELTQNQRKADLDAREATLKEREAKQAEADWTATVSGIASAAKGSAEVLKAKAAELGVSDPEKLRTLALTLWPQSGPVHDSGHNEGGGPDLSQMSPRQKILKGMQIAAQRR